MSSQLGVQCMQRTHLGENLMLTPTSPSNFGELYESLRKGPFEYMTITSVWGIGFHEVRVEY